MPQPAPLTLTPDQLARYAHGEAGTVALARECGVSDFTVRRALRRQGVAVRPRGWQRGRPQPWRRDARRLAEMRRLRAAGWTLARIGRHYDLTRERVRQLLA